MSVRFDKGVDSPLGGVSVLAFGASWDRKTKKQSGFARKLALRTGGKVNVGGGQKDVDLDLALILYGNGEPKRLAIGHNPTPVTGVSHSGDNQTGEGDGDDEVVTLDLTALPSWVTEWAVAVVAYKVGTTFDDAQNVSVNVYDASAAGRPVLVDELMPTLGTGANAVVAATGKRTKGMDNWTTTLVDASGRLQLQGNDNAVLGFAKQRGGI